MPSRWHSAAMLSSPRRPSRTMRIFYSTEYCLRVLRQMSRTSRRRIRYIASPTPAVAKPLPAVLLNRNKVLSVRKQVFKLER